MSTQGELEGLRRLPLGMEAARALREAIFDGRLKQGERVNEIDLSRRLGISRGPLREALRQLQHERLIEFSPYRGRRIVEISREDVADVLSVRDLLEPYAARCALEEHGSVLAELLEAAKQRMNELAGSRDSSAMAVAHNNFHAVLYELSGNQLLARLWASMQDTVNLYLQVNQMTFGTIEGVPAQHEKIVMAAERGDPAGLENEVHLHLQVNHGVLDAAMRRRRVTRRPRRVRAHPELQGLHRRGP